LGASLIRLEDIEVYLPKFLSADSKQALLEGLRQFPDNIDNRLYTDRLRNDRVVYQGDGIRDLPFLIIPELKARPVDAIIISNSCDIDPSNIRFFRSKVVYAPMLKLESYRNMLLRKGVPEPEINSHIESIRRQEITQALFLPAQGTLKQDSFVLLDRLISCDNEFIDRNVLHESRLFSLSDYGHYLFLVKISMHFCRLHEGVDRGTNS
jgi:hypothetical protein